MALTNNTKYRRHTLTLNKKVNGSLQTSNGFPITVSILPQFTDPSTSTVYPLLSTNDFAGLTDAAYNARLAAFYRHLSNVYSFFNQSFILNSPNGTDAVLCPLNNAPAPSVPVISSISLSMLALGTSQNASALTWVITISAPYSIDLNYSFNVILKDQFDQAFSPQTVAGVIPAGVTTLSAYFVNGEYIYIPEADIPSYGVVTPELVPGSEQLYV